MRHEVAAVPVHHIPLLTPTTLFLLTMSVIYAFQVFTSIYVMTPDGGPKDATTTIVFYLYKNAYEQFNMDMPRQWRTSLFSSYGITLLQKRLTREYPNDETGRKKFFLSKTYDLFFSRHLLCPDDLPFLLDGVDIIESADRGDLHTSKLILTRNGSSGAHPPRSRS